MPLEWGQPIPNQQGSEVTMLEPTSHYTPDPTRYASMEYRRCGVSGLKLPRIALGLWHTFGDDTPLANMRATIHTAFDNGITYFDLANNYGPEPGAAEHNFGHILRADLSAHRDELVIATKAGFEMWDGPYGQGGSRKYLLGSLDASLARLGLDYVDVFYHHCMDPDTPLEILWHIARHAPRLRKWVIVNRSADANLLEYISQQGGPGVRETLQMLFDSVERSRA